ncbi:MAG: 23S rRNA (adenine2503-C2)-methyltransferase, partial [Candidatus Endobugula sp.]
MRLSMPEVVDVNSTKSDVDLPEKVNLMGLSASKLAVFFESIGEKKFRAAQVQKWIHQNGVDDFSVMSNISKPLREKLSEIAEIRAPKVIEQLDSVDGTRKFLVEVSGNNIVETVFIPDGDRGTLCVSSQVGCSLDCSFCATGKQGFNRDLTAAEIIGQVWIAAKSYGQLEPKASRTVTNVVMMGMGEPLLNFDNVVDSMSLMMDDNAYGLSKR